MKVEMNCPQIDGKNGTLYYCDCLEMLEKLPDKSIDLIFTDTLWGCDYEKRAEKPQGINQRAIKEYVIPYQDTWDPEFHKRWFKLAQQKSLAQVLCVGRKHWKWWVKEFDPIGFISLVYDNGQGSTPISRFTSMMPYWCFGDAEFWKKHKFRYEYYPMYLENGFLHNTKYKFLNPSPKSLILWANMLYDLGSVNPLRNACDPFAGSGTLGAACEVLQIDWLAAELEIRYRPDAEFRIFEEAKRFADRYENKIKKGLFTSKNLRSTSKTKAGMNNSRLDKFIDKSCD
jgi:DNA modification methylase